MINNNQRQALQYVKNTNGGATKARFFEDHDPIGKLLWNDITGMVREDENGRLWLTASGEAALSDQSKDFDKWWDENEKQFMADACHMSEYHMALVVWKAAFEAYTKLEGDSC